MITGGLKNKIAHLWEFFWTGGITNPRRKFDEALQTLPKEKRQDSLAAAGECYCTRLFQLEQSLVDLTPG